MADGNIHGLTRNSVITIDRTGISPTMRFIVKDTGEQAHRVYEEGTDPKQDSFKIYDTEVRSVLELAAKGESAEKPARDRTGEEVKRAVYIPGEGYFAFLQRGSAENSRIAPIRDAKIEGSGVKRLTAEVGRVYNMEFQPPRARKAILADPASAPSPDDLGLSPESVDGRDDAA